jgi:hypothetical protein
MRPQDIAIKNHKDFVKNVELLRRRYNIQRTCPVFNEILWCRI